MATFPYYTSNRCKTIALANFVYSGIIFYLNCSFINSSPLPHLSPRHVSSLLNAFYLATFYSFDKVLSLFKHHARLLQRVSWNWISQDIRISRYSFLRNLHWNRYWFLRQWNLYLNRPKIVILLHAYSFANWTVWRH